MSQASVNKKESPPAKQSDWPTNLSFQAFKNGLSISPEGVYHQLYDYFREKIKVKNEKAAVRNLEAIFKATFRLTSSGSFHSMSLRDLSRETNISMGGLYNYISSKDDLGNMIEDFLGQHLAHRGLLMIEAIQTPARKLEAAIRGYVYMTTLFRPWYRFAFMETKGMERKRRDILKQYDLGDTDLFINLVTAVLDKEKSTDINVALTASLILSTIQDWYLKPWKYNQLSIDVDTYAEYLVDTVKRLLTNKLGHSDRVLLPKVLADN